MTVDELLPKKNTQLIFCSNPKHAVALQRNDDSIHTKNLQSSQLDQQDEKLHLTD